MVVFTCNWCGESLQKPKVQKHYEQKCRKNKDNINLTCMDCLKDFRGDEYDAHTKCVSEKERYSAKGSTPSGETKNQQKQKDWTENVKSALNSSIGEGLTGEESQIAEKLLKTESIPKKEQSFVNFIRNSIASLKNNEAPIKNVWNLLVKHIKGDNVKNNKSDKNAEKTTPAKGDNLDTKSTGNEDEEKAVIAEVNAKKKKNKKKKNKLAIGMNSSNDQNGGIPEGNVMKRKVTDEEDEAEGKVTDVPDSVQPKKKRKRNKKATGPIPESLENNQAGKRKREELEAETIEVKNNDAAAKKKRKKNKKKSANVGQVNVSSADQVTTNGDVEEIKQDANKIDSMNNQADSEIHQKDPPSALVAKKKRKKNKKKLAKTNATSQQLTSGKCLDGKTSTENGNVNSPIKQDTSPSRNKKKKNKNKNISVNDDSLNKSMENIKNTPDKPVGKPKKFKGKKNKSVPSVAV